MVVKVRFHLGQGPHYQHWQITHADGSKEYHHPETTQLRLSVCRLHNQPSTARRIHEGANKTVCAWISCQKVEVLPLLTPPSASDFSESIAYNPRVAPHWRHHGQNADGRHYAELHTAGRAVFEGVPA